MAAVAQGVLLDAATDLVDHGRGELDDVERVQDCDRVGQLIADGVGLPAERVQGGVLDAGGEAAGLGGQPPGVGGTRPAREHVQQACTDKSGLVTGQVDHRRDRAVPTVMAGLLDVLIDPEGDHAGQPDRPSAGSPRSRSRPRPCASRHQGGGPARRRSCRRGPTHRSPR